MSELNESQINYAIELEGYYLKAHASYEFPGRHYTMGKLLIVNRPKWKFWLPKAVYIYETLEKRENKSESKASISQSEERPKGA